MTDAKNTDCGSVRGRWLESLRELVDIADCGGFRGETKMDLASTAGDLRGLLALLESTECRSVPQVWVNVSPYNPQKGQAYTSAEAARAAKGAESLETYGPFTVQATEQEPVAQEHGGPFAALDAGRKELGRRMLVSVDGVDAGDGRDDDTLVEVHAGDLVTVARALARAQNGLAIISRLAGDTLTVIGEEHPPITERGRDE